MKRRETLMRFLVIAGMALLGMKAQASDAGEVRLGWALTAGSGERPSSSNRTLAWSPATPVPSDIARDLATLRSTVAASTLPNTIVLTSSDGRAVVLFHRDPWRSADPDAALGVTLWRNWRDLTGPIQFPDAGRAEFLSDHHLALAHQPREGPSRWWVVDVRHSHRRFVFEGFQLHLLRVSDDGHWVAPATDGQVCTGLLDPSDSAPTRAVLIPNLRDVVNLAWTADARFLLVEQRSGQIEVRDPNSGELLDAIAGGLGPPSGDVTAINGNHFDGWQPGVGATIFTVAPAGQVSAAPWPHQRHQESMLSVSPSGKFVVTQRSTWIKSVERFCRRTPFAGESDVPPNWSAFPRSAHVGDIGWLSWSGPD